jgi:hypothetical protein
MESIVKHVESNMKYIFFGALLRENINTLSYDDFIKILSTLCVEISLPKTSWTLLTSVIPEEKLPQEFKEIVVLCDCQE